MKENLCIIGCGWLGQYVGIQLKESFNEIHASFRSHETKDQLEKLGFIPFDLDLESKIDVLPKGITENTGFLLIMLPPFQKENLRMYGDRISELTQQFNSEIKVVFASSTGIYPQKEGNFDETFTGTETLLGYAEEQLMKLLKDRLVILRLGGLIGGQRHPIKYLSGKHMSTDGSEQVNLIHREDISRLINYIFHHKDIHGIFNVSYSLEISKKDYYNHIASKLSTPLPVWNSALGVQRRISTEKIENLNGFNLIFNPLEFTFD